MGYLSSESAALKDVQKNVNREIHHPMPPHMAFWVI